ncbi:hypothetical protein BD410DRAFT_721524 [Rickenella mellea]|uniref:Enhancer of polycomb-like protein n=1 Tax=Rickenella mellea TaxID=50990 RepID=A0A4Y7Q8H8_9AGAM|nr:hypothetical protein BD410DRAFT_721524 [Rickenella mellea]
MPRNQNSGNLALRNRNRVTNKTRLKVIKGNIDADPIVLDEDEERARVVSTAGVDAEDANEHHLQAVLSAASQRASTVGQRATRATTGEKRNEPTAAFIPVPDAAGVVENYAELYPPNKWTDPATYLKFSYTVDDCISYAIADGFTYYMDERDQEWLEKNNQEARGEGTSAQAAAAASGTTTRSGAFRGAKAKGKEPDVNAAVELAEDQFELVMGVFEKVTHDNTPFLHVSLNQGMPPFSIYQDVFSTDLPPSMFASYVVPRGIPPAPILSRMARACYPYWRDRRLEREGLRIIPALNFDESDTKNESYICFRRREIKAVRKTRASQVTSSDKLLRLKSELSSSLDLAQHVLARERQKRECSHNAQRLWDKRLDFVNLKRKFPAMLAVKEDEELLIDKERVPKRIPPRSSETPCVLRIKNRNGGDMFAPGEPHLRPRERINMIQNMIEDYLKRQKERDHHWEDGVDNPYQTRPVPFTERLFKEISPLATSTAALTPSQPPANRVIRAPQHFHLRVGRGDRMHLDRRLHVAPSKHVLDNYIRAEPLFPKRLDGLDKAELDEHAARVSERWKFDPDTVMANGDDEEDRILLDDFQPKIMRHQMGLLQDNDHAYLTTDPRLFLPDGNNGINVVLPFRVTQMVQGALRQPMTQRPLVSGMPQQTSPHQLSGMHYPPTALPNATPVAMQAAVRKMPPPQAAQHSRVSATVPPRPVPSPVASMASSTSSVTAPSPKPVSTGVNGTGTVHGIAGSHSPVNGTSNGAQGSQAQSPPHSTAVTQNIGHVPDPTVRPKSQNQLVNPAPVTMSNNYPNGMTNGLTNGQFNSLTNGVPNGYANHVNSQQHHLLTMQQAQSLKSAFASSQGGSMQPSLPNSTPIPPRPTSAYAQHLPNGVNLTNNLANGSNLSLFGGMNGNMNLKLPNNRQMQWNAGQRPQQQMQMQNGADNSHSPPQSYGSPNMMVRVPSINGHHVSPTGRGGQSPSHMLGHNPQTVPNIHGHHNLAHQHLALNRSPSLPHPSPPQSMQNLSQSPSLQHQQIVTGMNQGQGF